MNKWVIFRVNIPRCGYVVLSQIFTDSKYKVFTIISCCLNFQALFAANIVWNKNVINCKEMHLINNLWLSGYGPEQWPCLNCRLDRMTSRVAFQPQPFYDPVILWIYVHRSRYTSANLFGSSTFLRSPSLMVWY